MLFSDKLTITFSWWCNINALIEYTVGLCSIAQIYLLPFTSLQMMILSVDNDKDDDNEMIKTGKDVINIAITIILMIKNEENTKMARMMLIMTNR